MDPEAEGFGFVIRPAAVAERRACRMLLPGATGVGQRSRLYVAVEAGDGRVVGAAALGLDGRPEMYRGWQVDLRVIVPFRGRAVGRALMARVVAESQRHGISALHAWEWVEPEGEAARGWGAMGFLPWRRRVEFEVDLAHADATLSPLYAKMVEAGWVPDSARIVSLGEADVEEVARLHTTYLGGTRRLLMPLLKGLGRERFDPKYSRVLLVGGRVMGFTLGRLLPEGVCEIDANVLDPAVRMGWANLWLKLEAARMLLADGVHTIRYYTLEKHTDTRRISGQLGAKVVRTLVQMRRELGGGACAGGGAG